MTNEEEQKKVATGVTDGSLWRKRQDRENYNVPISIPNNQIEFRTTHNELHNTWVMRITADRRIEVNEDVEVTEAAQKVLEAMQYLLTPQPEQEPVAIVHRNEYNEYRLEPHDKFDIKSIPFNVDVPLFKSPQRTWVGLTDEEFQYCVELKNPESIAEEVEAKLRSKNI